MYKIICLKKLSASLILFAVLVAGCATTPMASLKVTVSEQGHILVKGKRIAVDNVGRAVKRAGAKQSTMIEVNVPAKASPSLCQSIKKNIAKAGFPNIFFVRGQRSAAYVNAKDEKGGLKKPKPSFPKMRKK
jgi:hypothetical protein